MKKHKNNASDFIGWLTPRGSVDCLIGRTIDDVYIHEAYGSILSVSFLTDDEVVIMGHGQESNEYVELISVDGSLDDLIGKTVRDARMETKSGDNDIMGNSYTWTIFHIHTDLGSVVMRWLGGSNGYHSEEADLLIISLDEFMEALVQ